MTDFVDRLLGRVEPPPIRPLIPTMFEPLTRRAVEAPLPMGQFSDTGADIAAEPPGHHAIPAAAPPGQFDTPVPTPPEPSRPPATVLHELHIHTRHDHSHRTDRLSAETQKGDVTVAAQRDPSPVSTEAPDGPATTYANHPAPHTVANHPASHTVSQPSPPPRKAVPRGPARVVAQRALRSAEPDVHISIGRVEITAAPPPATGPNPVRGAKRPQLSLDDYLRSRGADRR
jgi:hypothetical protein